MKVTPGRSSGHPNNELENTISLVFLTELAGYELHELARDNLEDKHEFLHTWGWIFLRGWALGFVKYELKPFLWKISLVLFEIMKSLKVFLYEPTEQLINRPRVFLDFRVQSMEFPLSVYQSTHTPGKLEIWSFPKFLKDLVSFQMARTSPLGKIHQNSTSHLWLWEANLFQDDVQVDEFGTVCSLLSLPTCSLLCCCFFLDPTRSTKGQILPIRECLRWFSFSGV